MKTVIAIAVLGVLVLVYLAWQGVVSRSGSPPGLVDGKLKPCPDKPNCVCSEGPDAGDHFIAPMEIADGDSRPLEKLREIVLQLGGKIESEGDGYLAASFTSRLFGFVDDAEFRVDSAGRLLHLRSASRVGYSDMGANRKRVEALRARIEASAP